MDFEKFRPFSKAAVHNDQVAFIVTNQGSRGQGIDCIPYNYRL
jgi:hypothetical protein